METDLVLTQKLASATAVPQLHATCREIAQILGFEHFLYAVRIPVSLTQPFHFCLSGYPRQWRAHYDAMGYVKLDPVVRHAFSSAMPVVWDEIPRDDALVAGFFAEAAAHGLDHGVSAPVCGRRGDLGLMSFARSTPRIEADEVQRHALRSRVHWFAMLLHEAVRRVVLNREGVPMIESPLTDREKDCLMWAADGNTSAEIAKQLAITERTVLFHIESAGRKLGVSGRHNIISRAVTLGEIELSRHALHSLARVPATHESVN